LTLVYQTPSFSNRWEKRLLSDWQLSGIWRYTSAYWVTASLSSDIALNEDSAGNQRPIQVLPNPLVAHPGTACANVAPCLQWVNPAAFTTPALGTLSPTGRDNIPGPSIFNMNAKIARVFPIREYGNLEFRAEAFNVLNNLQPGISLPSLAAGVSGLGLTYGTPTFGEITSAQDPRILQMALKFTF
jgi:hypothetical protein